MAVELTGSITNATSEEAAYVKTNARLDNIIADGQQTQGNTELVDIRTGADNVIYQTAGTAVRSQFTNLSERFVTLSNSVDSVQHDMSTNFATLSNSIDSVQHDMSTNFATLSDSVDSVQHDMSTNFATLSDSVDSIRHDISTINSEVDIHNDEIIDLTTELIDIRTGADGTVYTSAGAAVRGQTDFVYSEVEKIRDCVFYGNVNLLDNTYSEAELTLENVSYEGGWLKGYKDYGNGLISDGDAVRKHFTSYLIPAVGGRKVYTKWKNPQEAVNSQFIIAYDADKQIIMISQPWVNNFYLPMTTRYIRIVSYPASTPDSAYPYPNFSVSYDSTLGGSCPDYGQPYYELVDASARNQITKMKTSLDFTDRDVLPNYWKTYLDTKIPSIREKLFSLGNHGVSFMFFTDYHLTENQRHTKAIMKYIANKTKISKIIFGGDILGTHTINEAKNLLWDFVTKDSIDGQINLLGNHDINLYGGTGNMLTLSEAYSIYGRPNEMSGNTNGQFYFYQDNISQKIRYIYLNTEGKADGTSFEFKEDTAQAQWFCDTLTSTPDNYKILVFCHLLFNPNRDTSAPLTITSGSYFIVKLMENYNARQNGTYYNCTWDFRNSQAECMTLICGHVHRDYSVNSSGNIRIISTVCDANSTSANAYNELERTTGTYKEQAIDIFFVDTENNTIETIRVGAGSDRNFTVQEEA